MNSLHLFPVHEEGGPSPLCLAGTRTPPFSLFGEVKTRDQRGSHVVDHHHTPPRTCTPSIAAWQTDTAGKEEVENREKKKMKTQKRKESSSMQMGP